MDEEQLLGFSDYIAIIRRRMMQLLVPAVVILLLGLGLVVGLPSIYRSQATILIEQQEIPDDLVRSTVTSYAGERIQIISQRVMTTDNLGKIIESYGLFLDKRDDTSLTLLAEELKEDIELEMISADVVDPRSGRPTTATIAFTLAFSNKDPRIAQKVTNELVSLFLDENLRQRTKSALETSSFLSTEAERLNDEIGKLETSLASFKEEHLTNLPELQQLNMSLMERKEREVSDIVQQIRNLEERRIYLQSEIAQVSQKTDSYNSVGNRVMGAEDRLRALQSEYLSLATRYTDNHPTLIKIKDEISALKKEVATENNEHGLTKSDNPAYVQLETQLQATESELSSLLQQKEEIKDKIREYESRMVQSPQVEREYKNLTRDYENALAKYQEVKAKQLEAQLAESLERERKGERFSLIEPPQLPEKPDKPNRLALLIMSFVVSIGGGLTNVMIREGIDQTIHGSKGVAAITKTQPLGIIPVIKTGQDLRKSTLKRMYVVLGICFAFCLIVALVHIYYKPLDVIWYLSLQKVGLDIGN